MAFSGKYGQFDLPGVGDDEPVFVIRAGDAVAGDALLDYLGRAIEAGSPQEHTEGVAAARADMLDWQVEHGSKVPD